VNQGEERWEVEWCSPIPVSEECPDGDLDRAVYRQRYCKTHEDALRAAKMYYPACCFGSVTITPVRYDVVYGEGIWEYIGETEYYEGE